MIVRIRVARAVLAKEEIHFQGLGGLVQEGVDETSDQGVGLPEVGRPRSMEKEEAEDREIKCGKRGRDESRKIGMETYVVLVQKIQIDHVVPDPLGEVGLLTQHAPVAEGGVEDVPEGLEMHAMKKQKVGGSREKECFGER